MPKAPDDFTPKKPKPPTPPKPSGAKPGPVPDMLKIDGIGWEDAVKKSFQKKKPPGGWPK